MAEARKIALVTGSATGVGRATAIRFAKEGYGVVVNYSRSKADAEETYADVRKLGAPAILCEANVGNESAVRRMVARCKEELGGLDVLVNNAGMTHFIDHSQLDALTDAVWDEIFRVNMMGTFWACRAAMPLLQERKGVIVNVTSVAGLSGQGSSIPYAASKAALNSITKSLARAFGPQVRVNDVAPGPINTRWLAPHQAHIQQYLKQTPLQKAAEPEDIADAIWYLANGTSMTTGQILVVDGGRTM